MHERNYQFITCILPVFIPSIVFFDWLYNLNIVNVQIGLYLKGFATLLFVYVFLRQRFFGYAFRNILLYILILYILYSLFSDNMLPNFYLTIRIAYWVLGSLTFYYLFLHNLFGVSKLKIMLLLTIFIAGTFTIYLMRQSEEHQNASAYLLLWCLPLLFYIKKSKLAQIAIILSVVAIMTTVKRGAIVALMVSLTAYFLAMFHLSERIISKFKIFIISVSISGIIMLVLYAKWDLFSDRFADKGGSGRDYLYSAILKNYLNGEVLEIVFGNGINSVERLTAVAVVKNPDSVGIAAHSDWLQFMYDFGLFGVVFMILFHRKFIILIIFHKKHKTDQFAILLATYAIFTLTTIYSFILSTPNAIFLGIIIALMSVETNRINTKKFNDERDYQVDIKNNDMDL